ncbi:hypothetical protein JEQ12_014555 [Ovis aries]|uniref:Uncharacterized protein n=1 Tax=Ovis aries TaxID=9940 RepID=A0A836A890_SHEEP|nr:hypothetical protein JEQ12_014555 [Ovis aries]
MQDEMVLPVKREEDEGEKYDVVTLKIPMDHKEVSSKVPVRLANMAVHTWADLQPHLRWPSILAKYPLTWTEHSEYSEMQPPSVFSLQPLQALLFSLSGPAREAGQGKHTPTGIAVGGPLLRLP